MPNINHGAGNEKHSIVHLEDEIKCRVGFPPELKPIVEKILSDRAIEACNQLEETEKAMGEG